MLAFAGLDVLHRHTSLARQGNESQPCRICQVSATSLTPAAPRPSIRPLLLTVGEVASPRACTPALPALPGLRIRPPPTTGC
jgi:hypothetical protein